MTRGYVSLLGRERHCAAWSGISDGAGTPAAPLRVRTAIGKQGSFSDLGARGASMRCETAVRDQHLARQVARCVRGKEESWAHHLVGMRGDPRANGCASHGPLHLPAFLAPLA